MTRTELGKPKRPIHLCKLDQQSRQTAYCHNIYTVAQWLCSGGVVTVGAKNMREKSPKSRQASAQADVL